MFIFNLYFPSAFGLTQNIYTPPKQGKILSKLSVHLCFFPVTSQPTLVLKWSQFYFNAVTVYLFVFTLKSGVAQLCQTLRDSMDCSLPRATVVASIHGIFQARVLEWVAISFSRGSSWSRDWTPVSLIVGRRFTVWATREVSNNISLLNSKSYWFLFSKLIPVSRAISLSWNFYFLSEIYARVTLFKKIWKAFFVLTFPKYCDFFPPWTSK